MSYNGTKSSTAIGAILNINTGSVTTPTWTPVGEITDIGFTGRQVGSESATNFQSTAEEFLPTLLTPGNWAVKGSRITGTSTSRDPGQYAMEAAFTTTPPALQMFQVILPKTNGQTTQGDEWSFTALIEMLNYALNPKKISTFDATLKVSGAVTYAAGS